MAELTEARLAEIEAEYHNACTRQMGESRTEADDRLVSWALAHGDDLFVAVKQAWRERDEDAWYQGWKVAVAERDEARRERAEGWKEVGHYKDRLLKASERADRAEASLTQLREAAELVWSWAADITVPDGNMPLRNLRRVLDTTQDPAR